MVCNWWLGIVCSRLAFIHVVEWEFIMSAIRILWSDGYEVYQDRVFLGDFDTLNEAAVFALAVSEVQGVDVILESIEEDS